MAKPKRTAPAKIAVGLAAPRDADRDNTAVEVEMREHSKDAALTESEASLKERLEDKKWTKIAPAAAATPAFDDRKDVSTQQADFDVPPLLHVGGFDHWWRKAEMMLISQGHFTLSLKEADSSADTAFYTNGREPARLLRRYVSKDVLGRISTEALDHIHTLVPALRKVTSEPFRLLDLPAKLRVRILELAVTKKTPIYLHAEAPKDGSEVTYKKRASYYQPAICRASRQLRMESLPIFLRGNEFRVVCNLEEPAYPNALQDWSMANKDWLSSLRRMTLQMRGPEHARKLDVLHLHFTYNPSQGLQVDQGKAGLDDEALAGLRGKMECLNTYGEANGLEGQLTTMFFVAEESWGLYVPDTMKPGVGDGDAMEL